MSDFYITTPIYYVNANPHLGHAYTTIVADSVARFHRMLGQNAMLLTGTDEHGDKIVQAAEKNNLSPQEFVDEISSHFRELWPRLSINPDSFQRTTDERHKKKVQEFLRRVYEAGDIYFGEFGGYYCYGCERFYTEKELENGLCPQHLSKPQFISEKNYFFRMSRYLPWLKEYIESHGDLIRPRRYRKEALAMLDAGVLEDLCISRPKSRLTWGIELPFDHDYVCYVWFDALLTYIDGIGWPDGESFGRFWPGEHLIAKDILKPHAIFWPCMLHAAGLPMYRRLNVHGYWLSRDAKMSKSLGNVVEPLETVNRFGLDAFRYFLLREMRFGSDASFGEEALISRINADLANDLGNLFSRVLSMNAKYFNCKVPPHAPMSEDDRNLARLCADTLGNYVQLFGEMEFAQALDSLWVFVRALNKYVDSQAPWAAWKAGYTARVAAIMNTLFAAMRKVAICLWPVMPDAAASMLKQLGCAGTEARQGQPPLADLEREASTFNFLPEGRELAASSNLFPRIEKMEKPDNQAEKQRANSVSANKCASREGAGREDFAQVGIETFQTLNIRAGTVISAEKHPNADRIICLKIDFGENEPRQILSGIAQAYSPESLAGKKVCAILNLKPRKIRGIESHGMVLTVEGNNSISLLEPAANVANGSRIV